MFRQVHTDPHDNRTPESGFNSFRQDAAKFPVVHKNIVGPLYVRLERTSFLQSVVHRNCGH